MSFLYSKRSVSSTHNEIKLLGCIRIKQRKVLQDACYYHHLPIEPKKVFFRSVFGTYGCNPKYIAEEILRQGLDWDLVWEVEKNILHYIDSFPKEIRLVMRGSQECIRELATARIWIENERKINLLGNGFFKRPGQIYIQTWHGSLGIKKTGAERNDATKSAIKLCDADAQQMDYFISNASYTTDFYKTLFKSKGEILEYGCPRNDIFFSKKSALIRNRVCDSLGIETSQKILLYAPTFREQGELKGYTLDHAPVVAAFKERFGGEWVEVVRLHPKMFDYEKLIIPDDQGIIDGTYYPDMQELLAVADAVITDYSSCLYDYLLTQRPGFIFAPDMSKYSIQRGLRYPLNETPFPLAETNETLIENIRHFNEEKYKRNVEKFLKDKGSIDDGQAAKRVVELIKGIIDKQ